MIINVIIINHFIKYFCTWEQLNVLFKNKKQLKTLKDYKYTYLSDKLISDLPVAPYERGWKEEL